VQNKDYAEFLASKTLLVKPSGKTIDPALINPVLFPFQRDIVVWACRKGRSAIFASTGLGKTAMQVEWARLIGERTIIVAPLSVARQTVRESLALLGVTIKYVRSDSEVDNSQQLYITNYEMIEHFDPALFGAVVLDESSILKSIDGATKDKLIAMFSDTPYRLCCTATPAPNDIKELANHSEFLGIMNRKDMLSCFFRYSQSSSTERTDAWQLKGHAVQAFYEWLASWSIAIVRPSDLGYADDGYNLPKLTVQLITAETSYTPEGLLPGMLIKAVSAIEAKRLRHQTIQDRASLIASTVNNSGEQWIVWVGLNDEGDTLEGMIPDSVQVTGSQSPEHKSTAIETFQDGKTRVLVSKTKICGFGMNLQNCHNMIFFGIDYSWESYYQAVRRCWRFGQTSPVNVQIVTSSQEIDVYNVLMQKEKEATAMIKKLVAAVAPNSELNPLAHKNVPYQTATETGHGWTLMLGDSTERMTEIPDESIDLSIYSPPFSDLFVYSASPRDVGNSKSQDEFFEHYGYIIRENLRVTKPGRLCCVHCQDLRAYQNADAYIGMKDFTGDVIQAYRDNGWEFWHRITIDKDPQVQAVRLKDSRLLFVTLRKDSTRLAGGYADYMLIFKKPGENQVPVVPDVSEQEWINWARPVWNGIKETAVLPTRQAKANDDEKHMCPTQLPAIERCVRLWSNKGEKILSPFAGIGSEGHETVRLDRQFVGIELKPEYYNVALVNLRNAEHLAGAHDLFAWAETQNGNGDPIAEYEALTAADVMALDNLASAPQGQEET